MKLAYFKAWMTLWTESSLKTSPGKTWTCSDQVSDIYSEAASHFTHRIVVDVDRGSEVDPGRRTVMERRERVVAAGRGLDRVPRRMILDDGGQGRVVTKGRDVGDDEMVFFDFEDKGLLLDFLVLEDPVGSDKKVREFNPASL